MNVRKGRWLAGQQRLPARRRGRRRDRRSFARRNSVASVDSIEKIDFIDRLNRENRLNRPTFSTQSTQSTQSRKKRRRAKRGGKKVTGVTRATPTSGARRGKKEPTSEARRQKRPEWSGNVLQPDGEGAVGTGSAGRFPARRRGRRRDRPSFARRGGFRPTAGRRAIRMFASYGGGVFSLATFALVSFPFYPALVLFSFRKVQATC